MSNEFNGGVGETNKGVPESVSYSEYHSTSEMHSAAETQSYYEFGKTETVIPKKTTVVASRSMNEALKYSTQVATVIKAVAAVTVAAVVVIAPILDEGSNIQIEFLDISSDSTYIYYSIEIMDYSEDMGLYVSVHNDFVNRSKPIDSSLAEGYETKLQPNMEYKVSVMQGSKTIAEKTVWTKKTTSLEGPMMMVDGNPIFDRDAGTLTVNFDYIDPFDVTYEEGIKAVVTCEALDKDNYALCRPSDGTITVDVSEFIGYDADLEISYLHKDDPSLHTVVYSYSSFPLYMADSVMEINGVHLEGTDRDVLYLDMDYADADGMYDSITVDVYVNSKLSADHAEIHDIGTHPYVNLVQNPVSSELDEIEVIIHYSEHTHTDSVMLPQPDKVYSGLSVPYIKPVLGSMNSIERNTPTNVRFFMNVDDPGNRWSDYSATAYYITKDDRETHVPITGLTFSKSDSDCTLTIPTSVPQYNAAIYMTLTCTEIAEDGTTSTVTVFSDVVVPTIFVEFPASMNPNNPFSNGNRINFTVTDYIGIDESTVCTVNFDYREMVSGTATGNVEKLPDPLDTPVEFSGLGYVEMTGFDTVTSYSEGIGFMNVFYTDPSYGTLMLISGAYINGFRIQQG